jgi:alpha-galactosidase/6-phospho-beta-glucosidase family protein
MQLGNVNIRDIANNFIFRFVEVISVSKFTNGERHLVKSLVATLSLKRIPDNEIIQIIFNQTNKTISERTLYELRQSIKKDSYEWYRSMREGQHNYIHEFKERINEIMDLQKQHHEIIESNKHDSQI